MPSGLGEADNPPEIDVASNGFNETAAIAASAAATAAVAAPTNASFMALEPTTSVFGKCITPTSFPTALCFPFPVVVLENVCPMFINR